ncbi:sulfatase-like hydrolase/transferase [Arthrobacter psychrochitiniphilus]|uniref:sulfatase-like hydrolase/transferase n=1 Tax=Arthrobacter psychrochitiniphilus TaxID=291045 RepID=UPI003F7B7A2A
MNILLIMADQFAAHALERSRATDSHFRTPNLDKLACVSTVFTQAYTPFPLCVPARSSMVTGKYPHQIGIMNNNKTVLRDAPGPGHGPESMGHWFTAAGFDCAYAGKWQAMQARASLADGFTPIHPFGDEGLVEACHQWLCRRGSLSGPAPNAHSYSWHPLTIPTPFVNMRVLSPCPTERSLPSTLATLPRSR